VRWLRVALGFGALASVALTAAGGAGARPLADSSWTSYGHDQQATAFTDAGEFTASVRGFRLAWKTELAGAVVASPLAARLPANGLVVFAATEAGNVYAIDGDGGAVLWKQSLGAVVAGGGCGTYGVSSTGVVDTARGLLYVASATGLVHALKLSDGTEAPGWPVRAVARRRTEYVWGGLRLAGGLLYVPVASYCDAPDRRGVPAEGRLLAYDVDHPSAAPLTFDPVPGADNLGGIWGWGGVSVGLDGRELYTGVGNADPDVLEGASDSVVELTSDLSEVVGANRPPDALPGADIDIGAAPVLFKPEGCPALLAANVKSGELIVWRQDGLARGPYARIPVGDGVDAFVGAPSWSPRTQMLYDSTAAVQKAGKRVVGTVALALTRTCTFVKRWFTATGDGTQPQPLVAGDLVADTGGSSGGFAVQRAATGSSVWRYQTTSAMVSPLVEAGGELIGGDSDGNLYAFRPTG
jgi:outer membrane protein assembly factor BamB